MPKTTKRSKRPDNTKDHPATSVRSSPTKPESPIKESKMKRLEMPDSKTKPAVKDLAKYQPNRAPAVKSRLWSRPKPVASQEAASHSGPATSQPPGLSNLKASDASQSSRQMKTLKVSTKAVPVKAKISTTAKRSSERTAQGGPRDPYLVPSDSEDDNPPGPKSTQIPTGRASSASGRVRASDAKPKIQRSVPRPTKTRAIAGSTAPNISSQDASPHAQPRIAVQPAPDAEVILIDSSSGSETFSHYVTANSNSEAQQRPNVGSPVATHIPSHSTTMSRSGNKVATSSAVSSRLRSTMSEGPALSQPTQSGVRERADATPVTGPSFQSDGDGELGEISTPGRPSLKAVGKRSSHSVNSHLNIVGEKTSDANGVASNREHIKRPREIVSDRPKRGLQTTKSGEPKRKDELSGIPRASSPSRAAISSRKKNAKVRFEEDGDVESEPALKPPFKESECSDEEYRPSSTNEEQSSGDASVDELFSQRLPAEVLSQSAKDLEPSQSSPDRTLRSSSCPRPETSITPVSKPKPQLGEHATRSPVESKVGLGRSKHAHNALSKTSSSNEDGDRKTEPTQPERAPRWDPRSWMEKYGASFVFDIEGGTGRMWLADGPFEGWIYDGPGAGSYIPGRSAPDEDTLIEAEKVAVPRMVQSWSDSEDEASLNGETICEAEVGAGPLTSSIHQGPSTTTNLERLATISKEKSRSPVPYRSTSPGTSRKAGLLHQAKDKATERAERMNRTKQYVLAGISGKGINSQLATDFSTSTSSKVSGSLLSTLASAATPKHALTSPSAASETTSALITRQLIDDCAPPSNQELAELMSSSPAFRRARGSSPAQNVNGQDGYVDDDVSSSSSEPSSGIPARISPTKTPPPPPAPPSGRRTPRLDHPAAFHISNGIAERRMTRPLFDRSPSIAKPRRPDLGLEQSGANIRSRSRVPLKGTPINTNIFVELPALTAEERAEYAVVSPAEEIDSATPKSFREINEATEETGVESNDSDAEETLQYVLGQSHIWLNGTTEADKTGIAIANVAKSSFRSPAASSLPKGLRKSEPAAPEPGEEVPPELQPASSGMVATAATTTHTTVQKRHTESEKEQRPTSEGRVGETRKRDALSSDVSVTDPMHVNKKQKTDDGQKPSKRLRSHQRRRRRRRELKQRNKDNMPQGPKDKDTNGLVEGNVGSQPTVTPTAPRPNTPRGQVK